MEEFSERTQSIVFPSALTRNTMRRPSGEIATPPAAGPNEKFAFSGGRIEACTVCGGSAVARWCKYANAPAVAIATTATDHAIHSRVLRMTGTLLWHSCATNSNGPAAAISNTSFIG